MRNLKRVLSLVLVIAIVASFMAVASAKTAEQLKDLSESKWQPEIRVLEALNIVEGYPDGTYQPAKNVTRAELAQVLARIHVGGDREMIDSYAKKSTYSDVDGGYGWAVGGIQFCTDHNMVVGDGNGKFRPGDTVTIVEALKMLLTGLGYDPEIEGLQNVGAAWKANTLSKAREVGLLDRWYGDTNKECTRDDMALLLYNFLFSEVVKGYFATNVANVDTNLYRNPALTLALEVYFRKAVWYGVVVANEYADLDVYSAAVNGRVPAGVAAPSDRTLPAGQTQLFLYNLAWGDGLSLADLIAAPNAGNDWYFETFRVSTDLSDLGESVFIITDLNATRGMFNATGDVVFPTGTNVVTEGWNTAGVNFRANPETVFIDDYDYNPAFAGRGRGDHFKTVDFDGDGLIDFIMTENWGIANLGGTDKLGNVKGSNNIVAGDREWTGATWNVNVDVAEGAVVSGVVNFHYVDGTWYSVKAEKLSKLPLANSVDAVNFKAGYVTLSDNNQYYQSDVWNMTNPASFMDDIMDLRADPRTRVPYSWWLDCGGNIRLYRVDEDDGVMFLLTDATSVQTARNAYNKTVDTYQASSDKVTYATDGTGFIPDIDAPYGDALVNTALNGAAVTNLAAGWAEEGTIALDDVRSLSSVDSVVEIRSYLRDNLYSTIDTYGQYGFYNTNNGGNKSQFVYVTTDTDIYYVSLARDRNGNVYVRGVEFFDGYKNVKDFDLDNCTAAYAAVSTNRDNNGDTYYYAEAMVFETWTPTTAVTAPYFFYSHVSNWSDANPGLFEDINTNGELADITVSRIFNNLQQPINAFGTYSLPGFYSFDDNTKAATLITDNWGDYGIYAATVDIAKTGTVDYYVLNMVGNGELRLTDSTPVYGVYAAPNNKGGEPTAKVALFDEKLKIGDQIIIVQSGWQVKYVLVVFGRNHDLGRDNWNPIAQTLWAAISGNGSLQPGERKLIALADALRAYEDTVIAGNPSAALYDALILAYEDALNEYGADLADLSKAGLDATDDEIAEWQAAVTKTEAEIAAGVEAKGDALAAAVAAAKNAQGDIIIDAYIVANPNVDECYNALSAVEKEYLDTYAGTDGKNSDRWMALYTYEEVSEADKQLAKDLVEAAITLNQFAGDEWMEDYQALKADLQAKIDAFNALGYDTDGSYTGSDDTTTIANALAALDETEEAPEE